MEVFVEALVPGNLNSIALKVIFDTVLKEIIFALDRKNIGGRIGSVEIVCDSLQ